MANPATLKSYKPGQSGNPSGRPKGILNRSNIARMVLAMPYAGPPEIVAELLLRYPALDQPLTLETIACLRMAQEVVEKGSVQAFNALFDRAYGKAVQPVEEMEDTDALGIVDEDLIAGLSPQTVKEIAAATLEQYRRRQRQG